MTKSPPQALDPDQIAEAAARLPSWAVVDNYHLRRRWSFDDFRSALGFVLAAGREAEAMNHHPDISLGWGYVGVTLRTHDVGGLSQLDFELAARLDQLQTSNLTDPFQSSP